MMWTSARFGAGRGGFKSGGTVRSHIRRRKFGRTAGVEYAEEPTTNHVNMRMFLHWFLLPSRRQEGQGRCLISPRRCPSRRSAFASMAPAQRHRSMVVGIQQRARQLETLDSSAPTSGRRQVMDTGNDRRPPRGRRWAQSMKLFRAPPLRGRPTRGIAGWGFRCARRRRDDPAGRAARRCDNPRQCGVSGLQRRGR